MAQPVVGRVVQEVHHGELRAPEERLPADGRPVTDAGAMIAGEWWGDPSSYTTVRQRSVEMLPLQTLARQRPPRLPHLGWMFAPVHLKGHEHVCILVQVPQLHFAMEAAHCLELIRFRIPDVDGPR